MSDAHIRTTLVGSYPVPEWLRAMPSEPALRDAVMAVLKTQELADIDVLVDGELGRYNVNHPETNGMIEYFITPLGGIDTALSRADKQAFAEQQGMGFRSKPAGVVREKLHPGTLDLLSDWERVKGLTRKPLKYTVTSPYMLMKTLLNQHYKDREGLIMDLAEILRDQVADIDAAVVQVDEANLPGAPEDAPMAAKAVNHVLGGVQGEKAVHLCFGNYGGQQIQKGAYANLVEFLNMLDCGHLVLEFTRHPQSALDVLGDVKDSISCGVGVIDIKDTQAETPETVARRIEDAVKRAGDGRVGWVHPDCGFWMLPRNSADAKMRALVQGRDLYEGAGA